MGDPLVSVLMTSYNREKYIAEAIESVLASTFTDFELLIVDDVSSDRTVEIARSFEAKDSRIRVVVNEKNLGQFANRNRAAELSKGKYLKYLDSDDMLYPTGLEVLVAMMERFPTAGYGLCSLEQDDERMYPYVLGPKEAYERHFIRQIPLFHKAPLSSIIKRTAFEAVGGFTNPKGEGDYDMWLSLSTRHSVVLMPEGVAWYRVHDEQIDAQRRGDPLIRFRYFLVTLKFLGASCPLEPRQREVVARQTHKNMAADIIRAFVHHSPAKAAEMYRAANYRFGLFLGYCWAAGTSKLAFSK